MFGSPMPSPKISRRKMLERTAGAIAVSTTTSIAGSPLSGDDRSAETSPALVQLGHSKPTSLKQRAINDYRRSMETFGGQLSNPPEQLFYASLQPPEQQFDILIVGSGYGASICAARLAPQLRAGVRMAMIERGREWVPGTFKDTLTDVSDEARNQLFGRNRRTVTNPLGLHNVIMNDEVNVWTGSGLGGGSLVNANIALRPDPEVFSQFKWPAAINNRDVLEPYYQRAAAGLNLTRTPTDLTSKVRARRLAAERIRPQPGFFDLSPISVTYDRRALDEQCRNPQGVIQRPCTLCGDCITGCNIGAKNTLATNYLPVAKRHGLEIYTQMEVRSIEKAGGLYRLNLVYFDDRQCGIVRRYTSAHARLVILAAGCPGSPEILLNSQGDGLCFSPALGHRWSGNGDTVGFVIDMNNCSQIGGVGAHPDKTAAIGPTLQTSLHYRHPPKLEDRILIQEAAIPSAATSIFRLLLRDAKLDHSSVMLGMGHDGAIGRIEIDKGRATIRWPGLKNAAFRRYIWEQFEQLAAAHGGKYKRLRAFGDNLVSVHPLGGCAAADDPIDGVVNDLGQVFDGFDGGHQDSQTGRPAVHDGLYVADGSIVPSSLGTNPFMTICALAERIAEGILNSPDHAELFQTKVVTAVR